MSDNFEALTSQILQVRDLEPGDLYIYIRDFRRYSSNPKSLWKFVRIRDEDPFFAKTLMQTSIHEYPSEAVYRVRRLERD